MRTTLNIEEEALAYAKDRAKATGRSIGAVISEALKEAAKPKDVEIKYTESGFPYLSNLNGGRPLSLEAIEEAIHEEDIEKYRGSL
jgi:hypothetical protein